MSTDTDDRDLDDLLNRFYQAVERFKEGHDDLQRMETLNNARRLVQVLEKPGERALLTGLSPVQSLCVRIAIDLDIFTTLTESTGTVSLEELAAVKNADPMFAERVLRVLAVSGYVAEHEVRVYAANAMTRYMSRPAAVAVLKFQFDVCIPLYAKAPEYFRERGWQTPLESNKGLFQYIENTEESIWTVMTRHPVQVEDFQLHMMGRRAERLPWIEWFPVQERIIDGFEDQDGDVLIVDVAGGRGHDLKDFRDKFPQAPGRLILEETLPVLEDMPPIPGIECQPFDLFEPQPVKSARAYYMKCIFHDWADRQCQLILERLRKAMKKDYSKLFIEDFVIADKDAEPTSAMGDWMMLAVHCGMERTRSHWEKLLTLARFRLVKIWDPPRPSQSIIEAELA